MVTRRMDVPTELLHGLVKGAKVRALYVGEVPGSNPRASNFGSMVVTPTILGWKIIDVAVVARYGGTFAIFGEVLSYMYFLFFSHGPSMGVSGVPCGTC
jgi:hypothetical protein